MTPLPEGPFDVLVVDPPWSYGATNDRSSADAHYATMAACLRHERRHAEGVEMMASLAPVGDVAAATSVLYLWVTNPRVRVGFDLMRAYGFDYKTMLTWVKVTKVGTPRVGMGFFYRGCTEHVLVGTRGGYAIPPALRPPNVIHAERGAHSAKPDAFYDLVESTSPGQSRLDVFARKARGGWSVWGDEAPLEAALSGSHVTGEDQ